jgi:type VI secretion system protein ImpA
MPDLETLLKPISSDAPTGVNLRQAAGDVTFDKLKALRTSVAAEVDPEGKGRDADWKGVARECAAALETRSKDLELAVNLTDAWARIDSLVGLRDGIRLLNELCERFWDRLHPGCEAEGLDLDMRAMPLNKLGAGVATAASCALFTGADPRDASKLRTFRWSDFQGAALVDARATGQNASSAKGLIDQGYITGEEWTAKIKAADPVHLAAVVAQLEECLSALGELRVQNEKHFGADAAPSLIPLTDILADMRDHVRKQLPVEAPAGEATAGEVVAAQNGVSAAAPARVAGPPVDREEALRRLEQVAEYFRKNEPHSPIAHLVERAARWGRMPLVDVLREVIPDQNALAKIMDTLGVKPT